jgi:Fur family ferric uptake transcriptional regulator
MQVLFAASVPVSPHELWERGKHVYPKLGLVTVYRTLALLEQLCCVRRVHREDGCRAYSPCSPGHSHALVCERCGRADEFCGANDLEGLIARVERTTGYHVQDHLLQLSGLCPECRRMRA